MSTQKVNCSIENARRWCRGGRPIKTMIAGIAALLASTFFADAADPLAVEAPVKHVVLIGVDGFGANFIEDGNLTWSDLPNIKALKDGGIYNGNVRGEIPTGCVVNIASILTGTTCENHGFMHTRDNMNVPPIISTENPYGSYPVIYPTLFSQIKAQYPDSVTACVYHREELARVIDGTAITHVVRAAEAVDTQIADEKIADAAIANWNAYTPALSLYWFNNPDSAVLVSTTEGWGGKEFKASMINLDAQIGRIIAAIDASGKRGETMIVFCSDHGGVRGAKTRDGLFDNFKATTMDRLEVPFIMNGPGVTTGAVMTDSMILSDIGATVAKILKVELPQASMGRAVPYTVYPEVTAKTPKYEQVVVIGLDGLGANYTKWDELPNIRGLRDRGAWRVIRSVQEASSAMNWASLLTGAGTPCHAISKNSAAPTWAPSVQTAEGIFPTIFTMLKQQRPTAASMAIYQWSGFTYYMDMPSITHAFKCGSSYTQSTTFAEQWPTLNPTFTFIDIDEPDAAGHSKGWGSAAYEAKVREMDIEVGKILEVIRESPNADSVLIVFVSDHGGVGTQHGQKNLNCMNVPFIVCGPDIKSGEIQENMINFDPAVVVMDALGLTPLQPVIGRAVPFEKHYVPGVVNTKPEPLSVIPTTYRIGSTLSIVTANGVTPASVTWRLNGTGPVLTEPPTDVGNYTVTVTIPETAEFAASVSTQTVTVMEDGYYITTDGTGSGTSWEDAAPFSSLATFLSSAETTPIYFGGGTYTLPSSRTDVPNNREIYGGYAADGSRPMSDLNGDGVISPWEFTNPTIFDGSGSYVAFRLNNGSRLNGITIRNCKGTQGPAVHLYANDGTSYIENCTIHDNNNTQTSSLYHGGAVWQEDRASSNKAEIRGCYFYNNYAAKNGGAICADDGKDRTQRMLIDGCVFANNSAAGWGGAIFANTYGTTTFRVSNCVIANNTALRGGAVAFHRRYTKASTRTFENCTIVNNSTTGAGYGALHSEIYGSDQGAYVNTINNSIIWNNKNTADNAIVNFTSATTLATFNISNNAIQGGGLSSAALGSEANTVTIPESVDPFVGSITAVGKTADMSFATANWRIKPRSLPFNCGSAALYASNSTVDLDSNPRISDGDLDAGAYQLQERVALQEVYASPDGTGDGSSWENAADLQTAMSVAEPGGRLYLAPGTYTNANGFTLNRSIELIGGFPVGATVFDLDAREIDPDRPWLFKHRAILTTGNSNSGTALKVNASSGAVIIDGVIARASQYGIEIRSEAIVRNSFFIENGTYSVRGHGVLIDEPVGRVFFENCLIAGNRTQYVTASRGAGIRCNLNSETNVIADYVVFSNCTITGNLGGSSVSNTDYGGTVTASLCSSGSFRLVNSIIIGQGTYGIDGAMTLLNCGVGASVRTATSTSCVTGLATTIFCKPSPVNGLCDIYTDDYRLVSGSNAFNVTLSTEITQPTSDILGYTTGQGMFNIGAYQRYPYVFEFTPSTLTVSETSPFAASFGFASTSPIPNKSIPVSGWSFDPISLGGYLQLDASLSWVDPVSPVNLTAVFTPPFSAASGTLGVTGYDGTMNLTLEPRTGGAPDQDGEGYYLLRTYDHWLWFAETVKTTPNMKARLKDNITLTGFPGPVGSGAANNAFTGILTGDVDADGKPLYTITVEADISHVYGSIFATLQGATIENIRVHYKGNVISQGSDLASVGAGGIAGSSTGAGTVINNCHVIIEKDFGYRVVGKDSGGGGIVGMVTADATISNCSVEVLPGATMTSHRHSGGIIARANTASVIISNCSFHVAKGAIFGATVNEQRTGGISAYGGASTTITAMNCIVYIEGDFVNDNNGGERKDFLNRVGGATDCFYIVPDPVNAGQRQPGLTTTDNFNIALGNLGTYASGATIVTGSVLGTVASLSAFEYVFAPGSVDSDKFETSEGKIRLKANAPGPRNYTLEFHVKYNNALIAGNPIKVEFYGLGPVEPVRYIAPVGVGDKTGADWANAADISSMSNFLLTTLDVDTVYLAAGDYDVASGWAIGKNFAVLGGYDPETGVVTGKSNLNATTPLRFFATGADNVSFNVRNLVLTGNGTYGGSSNTGGVGIGIMNAGANILVEDCDFITCATSQGGSAVASLNIAMHYDAMFRRCRFIKGSASYGVYIARPNVLSTAVMAFEDCEFRGNTTTTISAEHGIFHLRGRLRVKNCLFANNVTGVFIRTNPDNSCTVEVTNCTLANNSFSQGITSQKDANCGTGFINNTLIYGNTGSKNFSASVNGDAVTSAFMNSGLDPKFVDPKPALNNTSTVAELMTGDYRLQASSPAINAGVNTAVVSTFDMAGQPRIYNSGNGGVVDLGAYETQSKGVAAVTLPNATYDYDQTPKNLVATHFQPAIADALVLSAGRTNAGTYTQTVTITDDPNWENLSVSGTLTIEKAVVSDVVFDCEDRKVFSVETADNAVKLVSATVVPAQAVDSSIVYYNIATTQSSSTFPTELGTYYAKLVVDESNYVIDGRDSVLFYLVGAETPTLTLSTEVTQITEGDNATLKLELSGAATETLTVTLRCSELDWTNITPITFNVGDASKEITLTSIVAGFERSTHLMIEAVEPANALPAGEFDILIKAQPMSAIRYVTAKGSGHKTGMNWINAASQDSLVEFFNVYGIDNIQLATDTYRLASEVELTRAITVVGGYNPATGLQTDSKSMMTAAVSGTRLFRHNHNGRFTIENLELVGNGAVGAYSATSGGAVAMYATDGILFATNCIFRDFQNLGAGGPLVVDNGATPKPSVSMRMVNCDFYRNYGQYGGVLTARGGGVGGAYEFINCRFIGNRSASNLGSRGTLHLRGDVTISNCLFANNGNSSDATPANCLIAINDGNATNLTVHNTTFVNNSCAYLICANAATGSSANVRNSIIYGNTGELNNYPSITFDDATTALINVDPKFVAPTTTKGIGGTFPEAEITAALAADYRVQESSPVINAGTNASVPASLTTDYAGNARIYNSAQGGAVDLGMYESTYKGTATFSTTSVNAVYDGTAKNITWSVAPASAAGAVSVPAAETVPGSYTKTLSITENDNWYDATASESLTITKAAISNVTFNIPDGHVFRKTDVGNIVTATYEVVPAQTVAYDIVYYPDGSSTGITTFPTDEGSYYAKFDPNTALFNVDGKDSVTFQLLETTLPLIELSAGASEVTEGETIQINVTLTEPAAQAVTVTLKAASADFTGTTSVVLPANTTSASATLTAVVAGLDRNSTITIESVSPEGVVYPTGSVTVAIKATTDLPRTRCVTTTGAGYKTGIGWENAAVGADAIATFANAADVDTIYIAGGEYTGIYKIDYATGNKTSLALIGGFDETGAVQPDSMAVLARPSTNSTAILFSAAGNDKTTQSLRMEKVVFDGKGVEVNVANEGIALAITGLNVRLESCRFTKNTMSNSVSRHHACIATIGDFMNDVYVFNTMFDGNMGRSSVIARARTNETVVLDNCMIVGNKSTTTSGATTALFLSQGDMRIRNSIIVNNTLSVTGSLTLINNPAGAIRMDNCTVANNSLNTSLFSNSTNIGKHSIYNSIFSQNSKNDPGSIGANIGNLFVASTADVGFVNPTSAVGNADADLNADWHLKRGSMAINAGNDASVPADLVTDFDGNKRIYTINDTGAVDVGAYESSYRRATKITLVAASVTHTYDGTAVGLAVASTVPADMVLTKLPTTFVSAGNYTDSAAFLNDDFWDDAIAIGTVQIASAEVDVQLAAPANLVYTGSPIYPSVSLSYAPTIPEPSIDFDVAPVNVGNYTVGWDFAGDTAGNYTAAAGSSTSVSYTITPATPTVSVLPSPDDVVLGNLLSTSAIKGGTVAGPDSDNIAGVWAWDAPSTQMNTSGTFSMSATFTPASANYNSIQSNLNVLVVTDVEISVTFTDTEFIYNGQACVPAYTVNVPATTDTFVFYASDGLALDSIWEAGTYTATLTVSKANYTTEVVTTPVVIAPAALTITPDSTMKIVGSADPELTWKVTDGIFFGTDTATGSLTRESGEGFGFYRIELGTLSAGANYVVTLDTVYFEIVDPSLAVWTFRYVSTAQTVDEGGSVVLTIESANDLLPVAGVTVRPSFGGSATADQYAVPAPFVFDGLSKQASTTLTTLNNGKPKANRELIVGIAATDTVRTADPATATVGINNLSVATRDVSSTIAKTQTIAEGSVVNIPVEFIRGATSVVDSVVATFSIIKPNHWVYGRDYIIGGSNVTSLGSYFSITVPANTVNNIQIITLDNNRPGDGTRVMSVRLVSVSSGTIGQATSSVYVTEVDQFSGTSPFSLGALTSPETVSLSRFFSTLEGDIAGNEPVTGIDGVSTFGAPVSLAGTGVNYAYDPSRVTPAVLAAGYLDTFNAYVSNRADMKPKAVTGYVYVAQDYTYGMPMSLAIDAVRDRTGIGFAGFASTPSLYGKYFRPYAAFDPDAETEQTKVILKTESVTPGAETVGYSLALTTKLYDAQQLRQARANGSFFVDVMNDPAVQLDALGIEVWCRMKAEVNGKIVEIDSPVAALNIAAPVVDTYAVYELADGRRIVKVSGAFFGAQPKGMIEYLRAGAVATLSLSRLTSTVTAVDGTVITAEDVNANPATTGTLWLVLPKKLPEGRCDLVIDSGNGLVPIPVVAE